MSSNRLRVTVEITGVDEDVAERGFRDAVDTLRDINRRIDMSVMTEPHDDTRGIFGLFIIDEDDTGYQSEPDFFTSTRIKELTKAVKFVVINKLPSITKAVVHVKVTKEKGE